MVSDLTSVWVPISMTLLTSRSQTKPRASIQLLVTQAGSTATLILVWQAPISLSTTQGHSNLIIISASLTFTSWWRLNNPELQRFGLTALRRLPLLLQTKTFWIKVFLHWMSCQMSYAFKQESKLLVLLQYKCRTHLSCWPGLQPLISQLLLW